MWSGLSSGLNFSIPGNGGPICLNYAGGLSRFMETLVVVLFCFLELFWSLPKLTFPVNDSLIDLQDLSHFTKTRRFVSGFLCLIFGAQIGYKFASKSVIYLLNPCHLVTFMQIILLFVQPRGRAVAFLFRMHLHMLSGATLALAFPILNTFVLPSEIGLYYIQHITILIVPVYLMSFKGSFVPESFTDLRWPACFTCFLLLYHFLLLQPVSMMTLANLNSILCPAVSDPFRGRFYRLWAVVHQSIYIPVHGKLYLLIIDWLLKFSLLFAATVCPRPSTNHLSNGHAPSHTD